MADTDKQDYVADEQVPLVRSRNENELPKRLATPHIRHRESEAGRSEVSHTTFNLMNTFIGAGLMSLPHAFAGLGFFPGVVMLVIVAFLCCVGQEVVVRASHLSGWRTFTELSRHELGYWAGIASQVSIILNNFGILIVYLIMIGDVLVGTNDRHGVLTSIAGVNPGEVWYLSRWFTVFMVCFIVLQPLILQKKLHHLAGSSTFAVSLAMTFGGFMTLLAIIARVQGTGAAFQAGINSDIGEKQNCGLNIVIDGISIFLFAYVAYYNVPPLMGELKNYSSLRMTKALRLAIGFTSVLYFVVSSMALFTFGKDTEEDVLLNLTYTSLNKFMGSTTARITSYIVTLGYAVKLMFIYPMENWALRENVSDLFGGSQEPKGWMFYAITYSMTLLAYVLSLYVRSVFALVGFIGSTACTVIGFALPAMLAQRFELSSVFGKVIVVLFWVLTVILVFHGLVGQAWKMAKDSPIYCF